jgi:hypothetical protein
MEVNVQLPAPATLPPVPMGREACFGQMSITEINLASAES